MTWSMAKDVSSIHALHTRPSKVKQEDGTVTIVTKITSGPVCDVRDGGDGCSLLYALVKTHVLPRMPVDFAVNQDGELSKRLRSRPSVSLIGSKPLVAMPT